MTAHTRQILPVLPLRTLVPLPGVMIPVEVGRPESLAAVRAARDDDDLLALVPQVDPENASPGTTGLHRVGLIGEIEQVVEHGKNHITVIIRVDERVRVTGFVEGLSYLAAHVEPLRSELSEDPAAEAVAAQVMEALAPILAEQAAGEPEHETDVVNLDDPDDLVHLAVQHVELPRDEQIGLLLETDPIVRLGTLLPHVERMSEVLRMGADIREELLEDASAEAREHVLRERMRAIKSELGEDESQLVDEYADKVRSSKMSDEARETALRELSRMQHMAQESPQFTVSQTFLDRLLEVPWGEISEDTLDVSAARAILDAEHAGLDKVKKRILEFIAVRKLAPDKQGPILCLVGPPGVGKTSLGRSIAHALGRKYVRAALGGVRDESEIRGHRRTYIGALTGRIVSSLVKAGTMNPVFVLDEVDKLGADHRGDPTSALLEVLDPEQNFEFVDHYLEVPVDLSRVMFIATANTLETIPAPLRDRMEIIHVPSYTRVEKRTIAERHLLPKQMAEHGLEKEAVTFESDALDKLIDGYTREAGVRNLERELGAVCRSVAVDIASGVTDRRDITVTDLVKILGPEKFTDDLASQAPEVGVATGLAWTPVGGDILFIEVREMPGTGKLKLTGQVGDVMSESVQAALSWVRANAKAYEIKSDRFADSDLHLHLPAGAIRKDGPSAGVAVTTALISLLTGKPVRHDVAITGEVTLRGKVLPVGGIKEKVLAAHRAGIGTIVLPARNEKDLIDIPQNVLDELDVHLVSMVSEALDIALAPPPSEQPAEVPPVPPTALGQSGSGDWTPVTSG